jgi:hypothetical protein
MKQTAMKEHIEWLYEVIDIAHSQNMNKDVIQAIEYVIEGAKAKLPLEKEQMENAVSNAISKADMIDNRGYFNFDKWYNETYHSVETNKMINHIGEVNEMVNHVSDVGKMVSNVEIGKKRWDDWDEFNKKACYPEDHQSAFADGFTRGAKWVNEIAKETLYTEEQVREAIDMARSQSGYASYEYNENEIIQSLKK